jgi:hypothetical protein
MDVREEMASVAFEGEKKSNGYTPFTPKSVKTLAITSGFSIPFLMNEDGPKPKNYSIDQQVVTPSLVIKDTNGDGIPYEIPLSQCEYIKPSGDFIYNAEVCSDVTQRNMTKVQHNKWVVELLNAFIRANDISTSSGKLTLPAAPADYVSMRTEEIKKLYTDKFNTPKKAIKYLADRGLFCYKDFEYDDAFETANKVCFEEICKERPVKMNGRIRVRLEGAPPSWWDGVSPKDSAGTPVVWARGDGHTFVTPNVIVKRSYPAYAPRQATELDHEEKKEQEEEEDEEDAKTDTPTSCFDQIMSFPNINCGGLCITDGSDSQS